MRIDGIETATSKKRGRKMKKIIIVLLLILILIGGILYNNESTLLRNTDDLINKAREVIPVAEKDTIDITYVDMYVANNEAIHLFYSGNENQDHFYLALQCDIVGENLYRLKKSHIMLERAEDIAIYRDGLNYLFLVNNTDCQTIKVNDKAVTIPTDKYPFIYYQTQVNDYTFLDYNGNELPLK